MNDKTVAIGAFAIATLSAFSGLMIGIAGGAFGHHIVDVTAPPLKTEGLQVAGLYRPEPATYRVSVPPSPTWQIAEPTTPRPLPTTPAPAVVVTVATPPPTTTPPEPPPPTVTAALSPPTTPIAHAPVITFPQGITLLPGITLPPIIPLPQR